MPPPRTRRGESLVRKTTIILDGHKSSVTLEGAFWDAFKEIAAAQGATIHVDYLLNRSLGAWVNVWTFGLQQPETRLSVTSAGASRLRIPNILPLMRRFGLP
jgi:hypothetical protein